MANIKNRPLSADESWLVEARQDEYENTMKTTLNSGGGGLPLVRAENSRESALEECGRLIMHFDERAKGHKKKFVRYKYSSVALTVGVTVLAALQGIYQPALSWAWALPVVSGLAAFCTTMVHATNAQELWLRSRSMTQLLSTERFLFLQGAGVYAEQDEAKSVKLFSNRLMEIWAGGHEQWEIAIKHQKGA